MLSQVNVMQPKTEDPPVDTASEAAPDTAAQKAGRWGMLAVLGAFILGKLKALAAIGKFLIPAIKFLKLGKILTTGGSMLLSVWFYALAFGYPFAIGFVLLIFVHEMGHVFVAWRQGMRVTAPIFLPGMGAIILQRESPKNAWGQAVMGIGGPLGGTLASLVCWMIYGATSNPFWLALAFVGFMLNLFNLIPVVPLDGGWIVGAVSPWLWLLGLAGIIWLTAVGWIRNPFVWLLIILSLPRIWLFIRHRRLAEEDVAPASPSQRLVMGVSYVSLAAFLAFSMMATYSEPRQVTEKMQGARDQLH